MDFKINLQETLATRFEGARDEMMDIVNHGIAGGFDGFIYTYEINEFFNEYENEIEDYFYEMFGDSWLVDTGAADKASFSEMKCYLVYSLVEMYCNDKLEELEAEEMEEAEEMAV